MMQLPHHLMRWPIATSDLRSLKWVTVVGPLLFLAFLEFVRQLLLALHFPLPLVLLLLLASLGTGTYLFAEWVFGLIARLQAQAAEALTVARRDHTRLMAVLDASPDGIYVVGTDEKITLANRSLERLVGLPREQILGSPCFGHTNSSTRDGRLLCESACPFREPLRHRYPIEIMVQASSGPRAVEICSGRILGPEGQMEGVVHVLRDLTARKEVERLQEEFISLVSHELKTPLNHIKGFASTLLQEDVEWDEASERDFLQIIDQEADRLAHLVQNILEMARLANAERGTLLDLDWHAPAEMIEDVVERARTFEEEREFEVELPELLPPLRCDRRTVELLLSNLLDNAVKYSPKGSPVLVRAWAEERTLGVSVTDRGEGISEEALPRIFDRFYRGESTQKAPGTGLGLAICRRVAEAHGGDLSVTSTPGQGTTFTVTLPFGGPTHAQIARFGRG